MRWICLLSMLLFSAPLFAVDCDLDSSESLNRYEDEILRAAEKNQPKKMVQPLVCILQMQNEGDGLSRYLSNSFLRPMLGGPQLPQLKKDPRYKLVESVLQKLTMHSNDVVGRSFVSEFNKGDWQFYTLFCEKGNTEYCSRFLPDEKRVNAESPLLAAASMMRLRKAYQVLRGEQRDLIAARIKKLYKEIPQSDPLKRRFIDEIYRELFENNFGIIS